MAAPVAPAARRPAPRSLAAPGPARQPRTATTAPGRYRPRPATARPPAGGQTGPSRPAGPSCRTRPGHTPGSAAAPALRRAPPPAAGGARTPAAGAVRAAWSPARHPARNRQPQQELPQRAQPSATHPLSTTSDSQPSPTGEPIVRPARLADRGRRVYGCHLQTAATGCLAPVASRVRARSPSGPVTGESSLNPHSSGAAGLVSNLLVALLIIGILHVSASPYRQPSRIPRPVPSPGREKRTRGHLCRRRLRVASAARRLTRWPES